MWTKRYYVENGYDVNLSQIGHDLRNYPRDKDVLSILNKYGDDGWISCYYEYHYNEQLRRFLYVE